MGPNFKEEVQRLEACGMWLLRQVGEPLKPVRGRNTWRGGGMVAPSLVSNRKWKGSFKD